MEFIYFLAFWGVFLTVFGLVVLFLPDHDNEHETAVK